MNAAPETAADGSSVDRTLARVAGVAPEVAARTCGSLAPILGRLAASAWPGVAWSFSRLTGGGFPIEFGCRVGEDVLRYTTEIAGPEIPESMRLDLVADFVGSRGSGLMPSARLNTLRTLQATGSLRYGAWLGGRHSAFADAYKLYAEVPASAEPLSSSMFEQLHPGISPAHRLGRLVLIGTEFQGPRTEFYFSTPRLSLAAFRNLLESIYSAADIDSFFATLMRYSRGHFPWEFSPRLGYSISLSAEGEKPIVTLFTYAGDLFGDDADIHAACLSFFAKSSSSLRLYESLACVIGDRELMAHRSRTRPFHGLMGFTMHPGAAGVSIALRPA